VLRKIFLENCLQLKKNVVPLHLADEALIMVNDTAVS
jgi:hypothetical protein